MPLRETGVTADAHIRQWTTERRGDRCQNRCVPSASDPLDIRLDLFAETSHSPALVDLVGEEAAAGIDDFCFIANPYYPTPSMIDQLAERIPSLIKTYPSSNPALAVRTLAGVLDVDPAGLVIGNGATELIAVMCDLVEGNLGIPVPTFSEYHEKIDPERVVYHHLSAESGYALDLDDYHAWLGHTGAAVALIINPGNPTGQVFSRDVMEQFLAKVGDLELVVVDESFIDFAGAEPPSLLPVADAYPNLVIVRSMSKHCGVPGLRLGYSYSSHPGFTRRLRRALPTWNINSIAEYFLGQLAATDDEYHASRMALIEDVRRLGAGLGAVPGLSVLPTGANFLLVRIDADMTAAELQMTLLREHRCYVRDCANKLGMDDRHIRVASQGREADARLIAAAAAIARDLGWSDADG